MPKIFIKHSTKNKYICTYYKIGKVNRNNLSSISTKKILVSWSREVSSKKLAKVSVSWNWGWQENCTRYYPGGWKKEQIHNRKFLAVTSAWKVNVYDMETKIPFLYLKTSQDEIRDFSFLKLKASAFKSVSLKIAATWNMLFHPFM